MDDSYAVLALVCLVAILAFLLPWFFWAVEDARKRGKPEGVILWLLLRFGPLAPIIWWWMRPYTRLVDRSPEDYSSPDDALAAAARLDQLGEWDAAITLYENAAARWPERRDYIASCLEQVREKRALV